MRIADLAIGGASHPIVGSHENPCTSRDLVARTEDGTEIDHRPPPMCRGEEWVISDNQ